MFVDIHVLCCFPTTNYTRIKPSVLRSATYNWWMEMNTIELSYEITENWKPLVPFTGTYPARCPIRSVDQTNWGLLLAFTNGCLTEIFYIYLNYNQSYCYTYTSRHNTQFPMSVAPVQQGLFLNLGSYLNLDLRCGCVVYSKDYEITRFQYV